MTSTIETYFLLMCAAKFDIRNEEARKRGEKVHDGADARENYMLQSRKALRCSILRHLVLQKCGYREMSLELANSALYRRFCYIEDLVNISVPCKTTLNSYDHWLPFNQMSGLLDQLTAAVADKNIAQIVGMESEIDSSALYIDSTCLKANIHFPVDWLLMRDIVRGLMASILTIRRHGLKNRLPEPASIISVMNGLAMAMSAAGRTDFKTGKKKRKAILRRMFKVVNSVKKHAERHAELLDAEWEKTDLSRPRADVIIKRIANIINQIPQAIKQARTRIISEKQVPNDEKILSLFDNNIHVIIRGKAGAAVEFGNTLFVAETKEGFVFHHELLKDQSKGDSKWLQENMQLLIHKSKMQINRVVTDRGFDSKANRDLLGLNEIENNMCPRNVAELERRTKEDPIFCLHSCRRAQTEGRIAILKNMFLNIGLPKSKGYENRRIQCAWAVLAHNLWITARLVIENRARLELEKKAAA